MFPQSLFKRGLARVAAPAIFAAACVAATPRVSLADHRDDHDRRDMRDEHHDFYRDHDGYHDRDHGNFAPPERRIWIEPIYRTCVERQWVPPQYRTVTDRVWISESCTKVTERVWVPDQYEDREVQHHDRWGGYWKTRERVLVCAAHYEDVAHDVVVPAHYEDVPHQVLMCDGHWEDVPRQELVTPGHWEVQRVEVAHHDEPHARIDVRIPF